MKLLPLLFCAAAMGAVSVQAQKFAGLAPTPPMGWNTWNTFAGNCSDALVRETADAMIASGMQAAGYKYIVIDDCWAEKHRDANDQLVPDPVKFPHGMKALGDYLHSRGFKFGLYGCAGWTTCGGYPGGRGHEFQDARQYASWGVDYLKYDWCDHGTANGPETYKTMSAGLRSAGRPIVFSLCEWGQTQPWLWAEPVGHLWRTTGDIAASYIGPAKNPWEKGWKDRLEENAGLQSYAGPDHWNDPDMLEVGNGKLTVAESRSHFSFWCVLAAPLIAGNDVRHMTPAIRDILTDRAAIAIDQDPAGHEGFRYRVTNDPSTGEELEETWAKPLSGGEWAVCILNASAKPRTIRVDFHDLSFLPGQYYATTNIWTGETGSTAQPQEAQVDTHGVLFLRLKPSNG